MEVVIGIIVIFVICQLVVFPFIFFKCRVYDYLLNKNKKMSEETDLLNKEIESLLIKLVTHQENVNNINRFIKKNKKID